MIQVWDGEKGKLVEVDFNTAARASIEALDTAPSSEATAADKMGLVTGSITFSADASAPCHCSNCVVLEQDVERLRRGIAEIQTMNSQLQRELDTKNARMARIVELENANKHLQDRVIDLELRIRR